MSTLTARGAGSTRVDPTSDRPHAGGFLRELDGDPALGGLGPNWFAAVMGTGIVANAAATLPVSVPGLLPAARTVWVAAAALLLALVVATGVHWLNHPDTARGHLASPVMSHFYGAPAMALLTVGAGALLVGQPVLGQSLAVLVSGVLWSAGTALGVWTAVAVTVRAFVAHENAADSAFGGWLMPVVPPMVSAATGPLLLTHLPAGQWRVTLLVVCGLLFGLTLLASLFVTAMIWNRLAHHGIGTAAVVPTMWIVLGWVGQSATAAHTISAGAATLLAPAYRPVVEVLGVAYAVPVLGFGLLWAAVAASITARTARAGMPFTLSWWSFTFPVGTMVTGTSGLALATGAHLFTLLAVLLYVGLLAAWVTVATRTARGAWSGALLRRPR